MSPVEGWKRRHNEALAKPGVAGERAVAKAMDAISEFVWAADLDERQDYVAAPYVGELLAGLRGLLACVDLGRLDAGECDRWIERTAEKIGWDLDREVMRD